MEINGIDISVSVHPRRIILYIFNQFTQNHKYTKFSNFKNSKHIIKYTEKMNYIEKFSFGDIKEEKNCHRIVFIFYNISPKHNVISLCIYKTYNKITKIQKRNCMQKDLIKKKKQIVQERQHNKFIYYFTIIFSSITFLVGFCYTLYVVCLK